VWGLLSYFASVEQEAFATLAQIEAQLRQVESRDDLPSSLMDQLHQITQTLGAGRARGYAQLYLGHGHYRKGHYAGALAGYRQALAQADQGSVLWPLAALGVGYALEAGGDLKGAQDAYQRVIDAKASGFVVEAYIGKGRAAEGSRDLEGAIAAYVAVLEKFPQHAEALGIADKVATLKVHVEGSPGHSGKGNGEMRK